MNIQIYQLGSFVIYIALAIAFWKIKKLPFRIGVVALAFIIFAVNPIRHKQTGVEVLERSVSRFEDVPEKVTTEQRSFEERQQEKLTELKTQSGDMKNEIHN